MVDKITSLPKSKLGVHVGNLDDETMLRLNRAVFVFLGLGASSRRA
jgi:mRNA interferase MazF